MAGSLGGRRQLSKLIGLTYLTFEDAGNTEPFKQVAGPPGKCHLFQGKSATSHCSSSVPREQAVTWSGDELVLLLFPSAQNFVLIYLKSLEACLKKGESVKKVFNVGILRYKPKNWSMV